MTESSFTVFENNVYEYLKNSNFISIGKWWVRCSRRIWESLGQWQSPYNISSGKAVEFPISFTSITFWVGPTDSTNIGYDGDVEGWSDSLGVYYGSVTLNSAIYSVPRLDRNINVIILGI